MSDQGNGVLITGATGFLGGEVLARLLERQDAPIYTLVRAADDAAAEARLDRVLVALFGSAVPWRARVTALAGDITRPRLGLDGRRRTWLAERVERIFHCAASVSFTLGVEKAREINVSGTRRMLTFAELCQRRGGLETAVHVSTAYVAGTHEGRFGEDDLDRGQGFRNTYEATKFEAEMLVRERSGSLPLQVVRPSIVVGDSRSGWTSAFNVVYGPLRAFSAGALKAIPARKTAPVDIVPVDYVADAMLALAGQPGTTYNLTAGERSSTVGEVIDLAAEYTGKPQPRVLDPTIYRRVVHPLLVRGSVGRRRKALKASEVLFPYFSIGAHYDDSRARDQLRPQGIEVPLLGSYFERMMDFAEGANWGRSQPSRHSAASAADRRRRSERRRGKRRLEVVRART